MCYNIGVVNKWPLSQTVKTSPSHGEDMGSIPVGVTSGFPLSKSASHYDLLSLCKVPSRLVCSHGVLLIRSAAFLCKTLEHLLFLFFKQDKQKSHMGFTANHAEIARLFEAKF